MAEITPCGGSDIQCSYLFLPLQMERDRRIVSGVGRYLWRQIIVQPSAQAERPGDYILGEAGDERE